MYVALNPSSHVVHIVTCMCRARTSEGWPLTLDLIGYVTNDALKIL
jgi:hypothetical protein